ncbi:hypothetical protein SLS62_004429 [Diatrype stigma]|uniref:Uncharacterized protein n=1 Tax=Diatrype stigma TaxID=117547 RepID=A0AAN9UUB4_9PEZI
MATEETTPLLGKTLSAPSKKWDFLSRENRLLLLYVFHVMACEEFYKHVPPYDGPGDRCRRNEIDSSSAAQIAIMGTISIAFSISNLFVAGWQMKKFGPKQALALQTFFPVIRVCIQGLSLVVGAKEGIIMMQASQAITVLGGPAGYILILNTIIAEITEPAARTGMFGILQGALMVGVAMGYFVGGFLGENYGLIRPFQLAAVSLSCCCVYCLLCIPYVDPKIISGEKKEPKARGVRALLGPLRNLAPQKLRLQDGRIVMHFGVLFLALGIFAGVLATGYAPTLIQMYSMTVFEFTPTNNSILIAVNNLIRGVFLIFVFPRIISRGRHWFKSSDVPDAPDSTSSSAIPTDLQDFDPVPGTIANQEPTKPPAPIKEIEGVGFLLPLASGSAPASKGVLTEMVPSHQRPDALQAMTLVEYMATFSTLGIFGAIFSALADVGKSYMTFYCNAAVAVISVAVLLFSRFPPPGSKLVAHELEESPGGTSN